MKEANATIHVLDPVGLETAETTPLGTAARIRERQDSLPVMADLTGGRTVLATNAPETHVPAILAESGSYYVLGFAPAATTRDGRTHRIDVRVNRRDVTIKARDRYTRTIAPVETGEGADEDVAVALGGVLPNATLPLEISVAPFPSGTDAMVTVVVAGRVRLPPSASTQPVTLLSAAFTPRGRMVGSTRVVLTPELGPDLRTTSALGLVSGLVLPPGLHEVRVAVERSPVPNGAPQLGTVNTFVDVPDFRREPLSMSGALIRVDPAELVEPREDARRLPVVPTARRSFQRTDTVSAFVQTSQGTTRTSALQPVTLRVRIVDSADRVVREQSIVLGPDAFETNRTADSRLALPVQNLPSGDYLLRIDAAMGERTAERAVRFEVE